MNFGTHRPNIGAPTSGVDGFRSGQVGGYPCLQLGDAEGLADVVERSQLQGADDSGVIVHCREEQHRELDAFLPPIVEHVDTEHAGHQLVEYRQVDGALPAGGEGSGAIFRLDNLMPVGLEVPAHQQANGGGVICNQNARHRWGFWHHPPVDDALSLLPPHERRRIEKIPGGDVDALARVRLEGEPLQYLEGVAAFADIDVRVDRRVLIPRPETEGLYELASAGPSPATILDLGTGSGVLAIALGRRFPEAAVHATDISAEALSVARANAADLKVEVEFHLGDLFEPVPEDLRGRFDLIVSNPPYVAQSEWDQLPMDVRREPVVALVAGPRGTEVLERIAAGAGKWLAPGGRILCEIGEFQAEFAEDAFAGVGDVEVLRDLAGRWRYVRAGRP